MVVVAVQGARDMTWLTQGLVLLAPGRKPSWQRPVTPPLSRQLHCTQACLDPCSPSFPLLLAGAIAVRLKFCQVELWFS